MQPNVDQLDSDNDGLGNRCDADLNNNGFIDGNDLPLLADAFSFQVADADFDANIGLFSLPSRFGRQNAFRIAVLFHVIAFILFVMTGIISRLNFLYYIGIILTGAALFYQHLVVNPRDLSRIQLSFFTMNGLISLTLFVATWLSLVV